MSIIIGNMVNAMNSFIKMLDMNYSLIDYKIKNEYIVFTIESDLGECSCPYCGTSSMKVHSSYYREIQDLPIQEKQVFLLVKTRKMFCTNDDCKHKTFSERHFFADAKAKKTNRLIKHVIYASTQLSSLNASKLLKSEKIQVGKSSICMLLKKNPYHCG